MQQTCINTHIRTYTIMQIIVKNSYIHNIHTFTIKGRYANTIVIVNPLENYSNSHKSCVTAINHNNIACTNNNHFKHAILKKKAFTQF